MKMRSIVIMLAASAVATGCATMRVTAPDVPADLRPPADQVVFLEARATGVQIYECAARAGQPSAYEWTFRAPEATLADRAGNSIGKHYAGPTWETADGSKVAGEAKARAPGPDSTAIPWLLLTAKSASGSGSIAQTKSVQRVHTAGGTAPSSGCTADTAKQIARVPYTATYYFYRNAP